MKECCNASFNKDISSMYLLHLRLGCGRETDPSLWWPYPHFAVPSLVRRVHVDASHTSPSQSRTIMLAGMLKWNHANHHLKKVIISRKLWHNWHNSKVVMIYRLVNARVCLNASRYFEVAQIYTLGRFERKKCVGYLIKCRHILYLDQHVYIII